MSDKIERVGRTIEGHIEQIKALFKPGVVVTVLVRTPDYPERDFCVSDDDLICVEAMVTRCLARTAQ